MNGKTNAQMPNYICKHKYSMQNIFLNIILQCFH